LLGWIDDKACRFILPAFDDCFLEGVVHVLDLAKDPRMIRPGQTMFCTVFQTDAIDDM